MGEKRAVKKVKETQVVIYSSYFYKIGGIETFIYNFCKYFHKKYEILIVYGKMEPLQCERFIPFVEVMQISEDVEIHCDTIINNRITDKIPENMSNAFVAVEDERFYDHNGIDIHGMIRAGFKAFSSGDLSQGASTITQQLSRILFLSNERTFSRKISYTGRLTS